MLEGDTWVEVEGNAGEVSILWTDEKRINHGKVVYSLGEALELVSQMLEEKKPIHCLGFYFGKFGMRLPAKEVENDPVLSSLHSEKCITLIKRK